MNYIKELREIVGHKTILMPCVGLIIYQNHKILLQKRKDNKKWAIHGGAIELDENIEDALLREVKEETGLSIDDYHLFRIYSGKDMHYIYPNGDEVSLISLIYMSSSFHGDINLQKEEVLELKWFDIEEIKNISIHDVDIKVINDFINYLKKEGERA